VLILVVGTLEVIAMITELENVVRLDPSLDPFIIEQFLKEVVPEEKRPADLEDEWNAFVRFFIENSPVFATRAEIIRGYGYFLAGYAERGE
jgi:hypothetical protein